MAASRSWTAMATWSISVSIQALQERTAGCGAEAPHAGGAWGWGPGRGGGAARKNAVAGVSPLGVAAEDVDPVLADLGPELRVADPEALLGRQAQDADLALVQVLVDLQRRLARLLEGVDGRQDGLDLALADQPVRLPGLPVVGEVAALDGLEAHPQVPVVVLDHVARGGGAGDDRAAPAGHEDRGPHGVAAGVLEDDVG